MVQEVDEGRQVGDHVVLGARRRKQAAYCAVVAAGSSGTTPPSDTNLQSTRKTPLAAYIRCITLQQC